MGAGGHRQPVGMPLLSPLPYDTMKFKRPKMVDLGDQIPCGHCLPQWLRTLGEKWLGLHALNVAHEHIEDDWDEGSKENFFLLACRYLNLHYDLEGLENIPTEGPCVIVSNHPHGMSDGLMFGDIAMKVRQDVRVVVNEFLHCVRGMRPYQITVDVYGGEAAKRANMAGMREILRWLRDGHCILVFPSGSAATFSFKDGHVIDDPWQANIASIIRKTGATVVPMHISGRTGIFFQVVSAISRGLRSNFLAREILRDGRMRHTIKLGAPIPASTIAGLPDDEALSDYLRLRSMLLRYHRAARELEPPKQTEQQPIAESESPDVLQAEIDSLPEDDLCYSSECNPLCVYATEAQRIPHLLREIGIQRERIFRSVSEGTGQALDLDEFDRHYVHLIMWDRNERRIAGAYRIGRTDKIFAEHGGMRGVYNSLFFRFSKKIQKVLAQGLEMGRAFIAPDYQRLPASLDTLWMGIGRYLNKHPEYRYLYGNVTVSQDYSPASRSLMLTYLQRNCMHPEYASEVRAKYPPTGMELASEDARLLDKAVPDLKSLAALINALEGNERNIPVLLKQYLRLGGSMLSFGIDVNFGCTLDCMVIVPLENTPDRMRRRYQGEEYAHADSPSPPTPPPAP